MSDGEYDGDDIRRFVLQLEEELGLFEWECEGLSVWQHLRWTLYRRLGMELEIAGQAHSDVSSTLSEYAKGVYLWARNLLLDNPFVRSGDILCFGAGRRKRLDDGTWWDLYFDPIYQNTDLDCLHVETPYLNEHRTPARTEELSYVDFIMYSGTICRTLGLFGPEFSDTDHSYIEEIEAAITEAFGVEVGIEPMLREKLTNKNVRQPLYSRLVGRIDPNVAVLSRSYGEEPFMLACDEHDVPVVELQHGVMHRNHLAYHYPNAVDSGVFPDHLLVWGEFWKERVEFPIPDERVTVTGYPYLEQRLSGYDDVDSRERILFISQGTIGERLSKFALELDRHPRVDHDIVYKLHPGECDRWRAEYPWLVDAEFEVIDGSEPPLYELFAESSVQVGVGSTAVYEGLCFDLETYVYDGPGTAPLEPLIDDGAAALVTSTDELADSLGTTERGFDRERYFEPEASENVARVLGRLSNGDG